LKTNGLDANGKKVYSLCPKNNVHFTFQGVKKISLTKYTQKELPILTNYDVQVIVEYIFHNKYIWRYKFDIIFYKSSQA